MHQVLVAAIYKLLSDAFVCYVNEFEGDNASANQVPLSFQDWLQDCEKKNPKQNTGLRQSS